jgi:hemerythrin
MKRSNIRDVLRKYQKDFFLKIRWQNNVLSISESFGTESTDREHRKLFIILNLDETNFLLTSDETKEFFQELLRLLRDASA